MTRYFLILSIYCCFLTPVLANGPQHEYEKPGFVSGHAYDALISEETVDLFTGGLFVGKRILRNG